MSKTIIIMASGEEYTIEGKKEDIEKILVNERGDFKNSPVTIGKATINPSNIASIKDKFEHKMMPGITGVSSKW
jgi:hypothetical protein